MAHRAPAGNGLPIVYTVRKNGVGTLLLASILSTAAGGGDAVNTVAVVAGDFIDLMITKAASITTSPSDITATLELA